MPHTQADSQRRAKADPETKAHRQQATLALHPANPSWPRTKKPFGLNVWGITGMGFDSGSWVTAWILVPINTIQPTKGSLGTTKE